MPNGIGLGFIMGALMNRRLSPISGYVVAVFRIRDIWIRIQILGSVHWVADPDLDPASGHALFFSGFQDANKNKFFLLITVLPVGTLASVFKDNKSLRSHKTVDIKIFHPC
jgi:hypothetical protein